MRSRNTVLAGTSLVSGETKALVFATGSHSAFGRIAWLTEATAETISPLQAEIARVNRIVAAIASGNQVAAALDLWGTHSLTGLF